MNPSEIAEKLKSLVQLDIDAIHAYDQAIEKVDFHAVKDRLLQFKQDHQRHIDALSPFIKGFGEEVPAFSPDFKGYLIQGFTALRSITGIEGALKAMRSNEKLTNKTYEDAVAWDLPKNIREVIERNYEDERRHLQYIEKAIEDRAWDKKEHAA